MPAPLVIVVPWNVGRTSPNRRLHWAVRRALNEEARGLAVLCWRRAGCPTLPPPVRVSVVVRRARPMDCDNALAACKPLWDGLLVGAVTEDDGPAYVQIGTVTQDCGRVWRGREEVEFIVEGRSGEAG